MFERVMDVGQLADGEVAQVSVSGAEEAVCIARVGESVYAVQQSCSHAQYPMADGSVEGDCQIECMLHGAVFDLRDGSVVHGPATEALKTYPVKLEDGGIWVDPR